MRNIFMDSKTIACFNVFKPMSKVWETQDILIHNIELIDACDVN